VRYPGAEGWPADPTLQLAKRTSWDTPSDGIYLGTGQRVFMTYTAEIPLLEVRSLTFTPA
jgi:protein involved in temperature-dependent protein secretion